MYQKPLTSHLQSKNIRNTHRYIPNFRSFQRKPSTLSAVETKQEEQEETKSRSH